MDFGERLESVFRHEARKLLGVFGDRLQRVPDRPVVHVAVFLSAGIVFEIGGGRTGPVGNGSAVVGDDALDDVVEEDDVVLPDAFTLRRGESFLEVDAVAPVAPSGFDFVVAAPERDARMVAETLHLLSGFLADVFLEGEVAGNHGAAEHEVLPDHDAEFVADVVKVVGFVIAAAPVADHVHVRVLGGLEDLTMLGGSYAGRKAVEGNDVGTFAEDGNAVDDEGKALAPLVVYAAQFDGAETGAEFGVVL